MMIEDFRKQWAAAWKMVRQGIENTPDEVWRNGYEDWCYAKTAFHLVETVDFYMKSTPEGFDWGGRFSVMDRGGYEPENMPSKEELAIYLNEVETYLNNLLESLDLSISLSDDFHWFSSVNEKLLYVLRHTMFHAGEMSLALRVWGHERMKWC